MNRKLSLSPIIIFQKSYKFDNRIFNDRERRGSSQHILDVERCHQAFCVLPNGKDKYFLRREYLEDKRRYPQKIKIDKCFYRKKSSERWKKKILFKNDFCDECPF